MKLLPGVAFSDATLGNIVAADQETYEAIAANFAHWDDIDVHYGGRLLRSKGMALPVPPAPSPAIAQARCADLGVQIDHERSVQSSGSLQN